VTGMPSNIGAYKILSQLGQGGMATVYLAVQPALNRQVALKVISNAFSDDATFKDRFLREARAGAMVNHPNVVTCYDAGEYHGQLYMAMELVTGGDLINLISTHGGRLDETLALNVVKDAAAGLAAIEAAGLVHRDIKPANIFLSEHGKAKLADLGLVCFSETDDRMTKPGTVMGTPAYIAPEQAQAIADIDIRADIYSLGATLYHLVTGQPPYHSESPITTLIKAINEPMPDPRTIRPDLSHAMLAIIMRATKKEREKRYQSAHQFFEDLEKALGNQKSLQATQPAKPQAPPLTPSLPAPKPSALAPTIVSTPASTTASPVHSPSERNPVIADSINHQMVAAASVKSPAQPAIPKPTIKTPPPMVLAKLNEDQLQVLAKRVITDKQGLQAWMILAPGASFPRVLLEQMIPAANICHGIDQAAIHEATRVSTGPRRIVLAHGDPPSPGFAGRSVRGDIIPALVQPIMIRIDDQAMTAVALTYPGKLITKEQLEPELKRSQIRFGIDVTALHRLVDGPADPQGQLVIARGRPAQLGQAAGFHLASSVMNVTVDEFSQCRQMQRVQAGTVLALWRPAKPGVTQMDVLGRSQPLPTISEKTPDDYAGEGTEIGRDRSGQLVLRATRGGLCQAQSNGSVRVIEALEINGDFGPDSPPINSTDIVVVRGNVKAGATIKSTSDVVIIGDLEDASITVGGSLEVAGTICEGQQPITVGGTLIANDVKIRHVMAGNLKISGEVRHCQLLASGDIDVGCVIGGSLTAGGKVRVDVAGDNSGTPTELWAGHNLSYDQQHKLFEIKAQHLDNERGRMIANCQMMSEQLKTNEQRSLRLVGAQFVRKDAVENIQQQTRELDNNRKHLAQASEAAREQLAKQRSLINEAKTLGDNPDAVVTVGKIAHAGVVARLADIDPEILNNPRLQYRLGK
jgi:serine/threonine protein kinase